MKNIRDAVIRRIWEERQKNGSIGNMPLDQARRHRSWSGLIEEIELDADAALATVFEALVPDAHAVGAAQSALAQATRQRWSPIGDSQAEAMVVAALHRMKERWQEEGD